MVKQKINRNQGTVIYNVEQLIVDGSAVVSCNCVLKNTEENNASDIKIVVSQRELDLRISMMIFMMISASFIFAFIYPSWWVDNDLFSYFAGGSWTLAIIFAAIAALIQHNRVAVGQMIFNNIIRREKARITI